MENHINACASYVATKTFVHIMVQLSTYYVKKNRKEIVTCKLCF